LEGNKVSENYIRTEDENGAINISEEVLITMVREAVLEVSGIAAPQANVGKDITDFLGITPASRNIRLELEENDVKSININIVVKNGENAMAVATEVQDKTKDVLESMTGLTSPLINVHIQGIDSGK
jgi:uncharacterized alkaline shock family protein YloU